MTFEGLSSDNRQFSIPSRRRKCGSSDINCNSIRAKGGTDAKVNRYLAASLSNNTRRAYAVDLDHFKAWGGRVPSTPKMLAGYLADHAGVLATATLMRRVAAISKAHTVAGLPNPCRSALVHTTLRGIRRLHPSEPGGVAALTVRDLECLLRVIPKTTKGIRDRAMLLVGFASALRRSELVAVNVADLRWVRKGLVLWLPRSKTDQEAEGRDIAIPRGKAGRCPVAALALWLKRAGITSGPLFRPVNRHGGIGDEGLTDQTVALVVKQYAGEAGLDPERLAGHSLRAGFVTSAVAAGVTSLRVRQQTGHSTDAMMERYYRNKDLFRGNAAGSVL